MEGCSSENPLPALLRKRVRDDDSPEWDSELPQFKRVHASADSGLDCPDSDPDVQPGRVDSPVSEICQLDSEDMSNDSNAAEDGEELASPEVVKLRKDILDILEEPQTVPETQDLDSVIRSFEEEILQLSPSFSHPPDVLPAAAYPGEAQPDLGYLLEASDDELGLPPSVPVAGDQTQNEPIHLSLADGNDGVVDVLDNMVVLEDEMPTYDSFEFGIGDVVTEGDNFAGNGAGDFVTVDGLFDYADGSDFSDFAWRPESLPAL